MSTGSRGTRTGSVLLLWRTHRGKDGAGLTEGSFVRGPDPGRSRLVSTGHWTLDPMRSLPDTTPFLGSVHPLVPWWSPWPLPNAPLGSLRMSGYSLRCFKFFLKNVLEMFSFTCSSFHLLEKNSPLSLQGEFSLS